MKTFFGAALALAIATLSQAWAADFDPVVRIGVLTDFSSVYKDNTGDGSFVAAQMAVDDFLAAHPETVLKPQLLKADHQNKTDIGLQVARQWYDQGVDVIADIANSAIALGISSLAAQDDKVVLVTSAGTTDLTGKSCNTNTLQWGFDNYSNTGVVKSLVKTGLKTWFFITADYTYGQNLEKQAQQFVEAAGGRVVGDVKHPLGTQDFSSYVLTAQASGAPGDRPRQRRERLHQCPETGLGIRRNKDAGHCRHVYGNQRPACARSRRRRRPPVRSALLLGRK